MKKLLIFLSVLAFFQPVPPGTERAFLPLLALLALGSIGTSAVSAVTGSKAASSAAATEAQGAKDAAQINAQSANDALNFQKWAYLQGRQDLAPWTSVQKSGLYRLSDLMGLHRTPVQNDNQLLAMPTQGQTYNPQPTQVPQQGNNFDELANRYKVRMG